MLGFKQVIYAAFFLMPANILHDVPFAKTQPVFMDKFDGLYCRVLVVTSTHLQLHGIIQLASPMFVHGRHNPVAKIVLKKSDRSP